MTPTAEELRPEVLKALGVKEEDLFLGFGEDFPECLCLVVLRDVGPSKMDRIVKLIAKRVKAGQELRLCANIVEEKYKPRFKNLGFESAWKLSWDVNCATVRAE